jgi:hypothetical protein
MDGCERIDIEARNARNATLVQNDSRGNTSQATTKSTKNTGLDFPKESVHIRPVKFQ